MGGSDGCRSRSLSPGKVTEAYDGLFAEITLSIIHVVISNRGQQLLGLRGRLKRRRAVIAWPIRNVLCTLYKQFAHA